MKEKAEQYQAQLAVKENLIKMLHDLTSEQEKKIETLENHIQGTVPKHPKPAKPSSIAKLVEAVQVAHKEINRIHDMWFNADYERVTFKTQLSDFEKKLREATTFYRIAECKYCRCFTFQFFKVMIEPLSKVPSLTLSEKELSSWFCGSQFGVK